MGRARRAEGAVAALHVYVGGDGRWAWAYREAEGGFELNSNLTYPSREEAVESARLAYPDLPLAEGDDEGARR